MVHQRLKIIEMEYIGWVKSVYGAHAKSEKYAGVFIEYDDFVSELSNEDEWYLPRCELGNFMVNWMNDVSWVNDHINDSKRRIRHVAEEAVLSTCLGNPLFDKAVIKDSLIFDLLLCFDVYVTRKVGVSSIDNAFSSSLFHCYSQGVWASWWTGGADLNQGELHVFRYPYGHGVS